MYFLCIRPSLYIPFYYNTDSTIYPETSVIMRLQCIYILFFLVFWAMVNYFNSLYFIELVFVSVSLLRDLKHANIVTLHDIIHTNRSLTIVFEYLVYFKIIHIFHFVNKFVDFISSLIIHLLLSSLGSRIRIVDDSYPLQFSKKKIWVPDCQLEIRSCPL